MIQTPRAQNVENKGKSSVQLVGFVLSAALVGTGAAFISQDKSQVFCTCCEAYMGVLWSKALSTT